MNKLMFGFVAVLLIGLGAAATSDPSFCCERTTDGGWCVNDEESACDTSYSIAPTSCESTSFCRLGTCYESEEGICMERTPGIVCRDGGGTWDERGVNEIPQCQLGCCIIADQAAFVPLVRCKRLSTLFGVENDYRTDIKSEVECIAIANAQDVGACVYDKDFERVCDFTTRGECGAVEQVEIIGENASIDSGKIFYQDFLCSAEELSTACARQTTTTCYKGDVYWVDSCGNRENVYSDDMDRSWNRGKVIDSGDVCDANDGSDIDCGNCDYMLGSRCAEWSGFAGGPEYGDNYCRRTECVDRDGAARINGESWCINDGVTGDGTDPAGSRYYREICVDGEVRVEACADYRNEICLDGSIETSVGTFETAACRVNRWQDCMIQTKGDDCRNTDKRDCIWSDALPGVDWVPVTDPSSAGTGSVIAPITGKSIFSDDGGDEGTPTAVAVLTGICLPNYPPGLKFWDDSSASIICAQAHANCTVYYEEKLYGSKKCVENCDCLLEGWAAAANQICSMLGDCGGYVNYQGTYTDDGYEWTIDGTSAKPTDDSELVLSDGILVAATG
jgi:hypothetical protein